MNNLLEIIDVNPIIETDRYIFNGNNVPRVTDILSKMLNEEFLMYWSNSLGWKRKSYKETLAHAAFIGQWGHDAVEYYIKNNDIIPDIPRHIEYEVMNVLNSFINWYIPLCNNNKVKILGMEEKLICKHYGGTYDLLIEINGKVYLVDFKTSNHIGYRYFIQIAVYEDLLKQKGINVDGVIILQLSKTNDIFTEYILHMDRSDHRLYMNQCLQTFHGLCYSYHYRLHIESETKRLMNEMVS